MYHLPMGNLQKLKGVKIGARGDWQLTKEGLSTMIQREKETFQELLRQQKHQLYMLNVALSNTVDFNYVLDLDGRFLYVNKPLLELWGKTLEEAVGKNFEELGYPPHLVQLHELQIKQVIQTKKPVKGENPYTNPQGKAGYYEYTIVPVFDEKGNVEAIAGSTHDITEKKRAEEKEKNEEAQRIMRADMQEQYLRALESKDVPVGIVILEGEKRLITFVNPVISKLWGRTKEQVLNRPLFEAIPELDGQVFKNLLEGVYTTGIPYFGTEVPAVFIIDEKEEIVYFNFVYSPIRNEKGAITGIFVTAIDVTAQVHAKQQVIAEQQRLYDFFQHAPAAIAVIRGKDQVYELANELYQKLVGKTAEQLIGNPGRKSLPELIPQGIWDIFDTVYSTGETFFGQEFPVQLDRLGDGNLDQRYFNFVAQPIKNDKGEVERIFIHAVEVTDQVEARKRAEESEARLEQRKRLYEAITASTPDLIYVFDLHYRFTYANEALLKMWGRTWDESIGKRLLEVGYEPWHAEMHEREIDQIITTKQAIRGEVAFPHATLGRRIYDYIFTPVLNTQGEVEAIAGTTRDITELKELSRQKDEFLAVASHELKTPVTSIKAYAQVLQRLFKNKGDVQSVELLAKIDGQINKLITLIADLLDVSKMQAGKLQLRLHTFDFDELVTEVVDDIQRTITQHTIRTELTQNTMVYGDRDRIGQVITNLLTNAVKYSSDADTIVVRSSVATETVTLCVEDFGLGIPREKQAKVFERFYRVEGSKENIYPGLGLGLYISSEIIRRHGGTIWIESTEGQGSTFCFTVPTRKRTLQQQEDSLDEEAIKHE